MNANRDRRAGACASDHGVAVGRTTLAWERLAIAFAVVAVGLMLDAIYTGHGFPLAVAGAGVVATGVIWRAGHATYAPRLERADQMSTVASGAVVLAIVLLAFAALIAVVL